VTIIQTNKRLSIQLLRLGEVRGFYIHYSILLDAIISKM
jgi:hypothetical protein